MVALLVALEGQLQTNRRLNGKLFRDELVKTGTTKEGGRRIRFTRPGKDDTRPQTFLRLAAFFPGNGWYAPAYVDDVSAAVRHEAINYSLLAPADPRADAGHAGRCIAQHRPASRYRPPA